MDKNMSRTGDYLIELATDVMNFLLLKDDENNTTFNKVQEWILANTELRDPKAYPAEQIVYDMIKRGVVKTTYKVTKRFVTGFLKGTEETELTSVEFQVGYNYGGHIGTSAYVVTKIEFVERTFA